MDYRYIYSAVNKIKDIERSNNVTNKIINFVDNVLDIDICDGIMNSVQLFNNHYLIFVYSQNIQKLSYVTYEENGYIYDILLIDEDMFNDYVPFHCVWDVIKNIYSIIIDNNQNHLLCDCEKKLQEAATVVLTSLTIMDLSYTEDEIKEIQGFIYYRNTKIMYKSIFKYIVDENMYYSENNINMAIDSLLNNGKILKVLRENIDEQSYNF